MIKKFIILFLIVLLFALSFLFFKKDDKYKLPRQYKIEIQKVIEDEAPKTKKEIDEIVEDVKINVEKYKNNPSSLSDLDIINLDLTAELYIYSPLFNLYINLINITDKYSKEKSNLHTDYIGALIEYMQPYIEKNKINDKKLIELSIYSNEQQKLVEHYIESAEIHLSN